MSHLWANNLPAITTPESSPIDIFIVQPSGKKISIQVKTASQPMELKRNENNYWRYAYRLTRTGHSKYYIKYADDVEMFALVALDIKKIAFIPHNKNITSKTLTESDFDKNRYSFISCLKDLE